MGESETAANRQAGNPSGTGDGLMQSLEADFQALQRHFAAQLSNDIEYLEAEKGRLQAAVEALRQEYDTLLAQYRSLQAQSEATLSQQQLAQQQLWAKQLSRVMAKHLQDDLLAYVASAARQDLIAPNSAQVILNSLDDTLANAMQSLQRDLTSYQSAISQQLSRMQAMEQQGEVILDNLVNRLSQQLQERLSHGQGLPANHSSMALNNLPLNNLPLLEGKEALSERPRAGETTGVGMASVRLVPPYGGKTVALPQAAALKSTPLPRSQERSRPKSIQKGVMFSAIAMLLMIGQTLIVAALSRGGTLMGFSFEALESFSVWNAVALVWIRTLVMVPMLAVLAPQLHPPVWQDLKQWWCDRNANLWWQLGLGSFCLFWSQTFLYQAVAGIGPVFAIALLFLYPLITIPLSWATQSRQPSSLRWVVVVALMMGGILCARPLWSEVAGSTASIGAGMLAAVGFGLYLMTMSQQAARQCHPIAAGLVQFSLMILFSSLILLVNPLGFASGMSTPGTFVGVGLILGLVMGLSYIFNYAGLRLIGGVRAALIASSTPLLTGILAFALMPSTQLPLHIIQWAGVVLVTIGSFALAMDRLGKK
jgi:drug/metabolite transporter (DMT)-like permease